MVDSPSGRMPATAPRWDLADTEGYDGGNCIVVAPWMFLGYVGLYRRKKYVGGATGGPRGWGRAWWGRARPPTSWPPVTCLDVGSKSPELYSVKKSRSRMFHSIWTPFDIPFLRNPKTGKKQQFWAGPPVNRLVPKII